MKNFKSSNRSTAILSLALGLGGIACFASLGMADNQCEPEWETIIGQPGVSSTVFALATFDEGQGEVLFAGGFFSQAGGQEALRIARWDGTAWSPVGGGLGGGGDVFAIAIHNDGSGPALYAGGHFTLADGQPVNRIARWDGRNWSALGEGVGGQIIDLEVFDDGSGPALYAVGDFTEAGRQPATYIARWDGSDWSSVGGGLNNIATGLAVYDDGNGPALYASGIFTDAGGVTVNNIARWDGSDWSDVGGGANAFVATVNTIDLDDGNGPALYAGGAFTSVGGNSANRIARWDGNDWTPLGGGVNGIVRDIIGFDDGTGDGAAIYAGGQFTAAGDVAANRIARWDGTEWTRLSTGLEGGPGNPAVQTLLVNHGITADESGLYVGGSFAFAGGQNASNIATWRGCAVDAPDCPADLNGDGVVGGADLLILLGAWGECDDPDDCPADLNGDGHVNGSDLLILLGGWGPCPK